MPSGRWGGGEEVGVAVVRTFLFTDIEGSTRTWQSAPDGTASALARHDAILRDAVAANGGTVVKHTGDGILAVFGSPRSAADAAVAAQRALVEAVPFSVRMAVTTGEAHARGDDWFGPALNRCARLLDAGHGGQILVSAASAALLRDVPVAEMRLDDLGEHRLRDLPEAQSIYQLSVPGLPERHPPLRTAAAPVHTLPATRTPLVGREEELREVAELLQRTRLLTVTGVGGVGKTRIAIEVAARELPGRPGGAFFVELASVTSSGGVAAAVVQAAGIGEASLAAAGSAGEQLVAFLAPRDALLVLDNCEHVLDECADLADSLLDACPRLTILATSREPLGVEGEQVWRAPSLPTHGPRSDAVRLFLDRAGPDVESAAGDEQLTHVVDICRHLDGIPLAIELAASQAVHLSIEEIARRLTDRFSLLTGGRRRVERQRTLVAAVDWSHELLDDPERSMLRRLAVFPSWFDLAAVEAVCGEDLHRSAVRLLGALVSKSLVVPDTRRSRYRLLETIRLYAEERLVAAGEAQELRDRHTDWVFETFERLGAAAERTLEGIEAMTALEDDLRSALQWSIAHGELARAAAALSWSGTYWWFTGRSEEGLAWLALVENADLGDTERAALLGLKAALLLGRGDPTEALAGAEEARQADPDDCSFHRLQADLILGLLLLAAPGAQERLDELIRRARRVDAPYFLRQARDYRAHVQLVEDPHGAVAEWADLVATGDRERRTIDDFFALLDLGGGRHLIGDHHGTLAAADELDRRGFSIGPGWTNSVATYLRALAFAALGESEEAREQVSRLRDEARRTGATLSAKDCGVACAAVLAAEGDLTLAARVLGAVRGTARTNNLSPITFALHRHYVFLVRERLGERVARTLYDDARAADLLTLVDEVLGGPPSDEIAPSEGVSADDRAARDWLARFDGG